MSGVEVLGAAVHLGKALYNLKCKYDQQNENQSEINELQIFIEQFEAQLPGLRRGFRQCKGNPAGDTALKQLEIQITNATRTIQRWGASTSNFFTMLTSPQRLKEIQKLHRSLMSATQNHLSIASISMLLDIRTEQVNMRGDLPSDLKALLISGMADMSQTVAKEVRIAASEASRASYADEKFWADVLGALESNGVKDASTAVHLGDDQDVPDRFRDPILADIMVDPVLASNGITYCRWTILDNNMIKDPHNPNEKLTILGDNVSLRSELFERFPDLSKKFRQRRNDCRNEALSLSTRGRLADAMAALQHVLRWDKKDTECLAALAQVQAKMMSVMSQQGKPSSTNKAGAPPNLVPKTDCVVPDSSTLSSVILAQIALKEFRMQKPQTATKSVAPSKPLHNSTASSAVAARQSLQGFGSKSMINRPPPRRPPPLPQFHQIPPKLEPERRLARPSSQPHTGGIAQGHQINLDQERLSLQKGEGANPQSSQDSEEGFIPTPVQRRQQHSVRPAPSCKEFSRSENYPREAHVEGPSSSLGDQAAGPSKWKVGLMTSLAVADRLAGALVMSPVGPVGAYKEVKKLHKQTKDGEKKKSGGATEGASANVGTFDGGYYEEEGYTDPDCGAQVWNDSDYRSQSYETDHHEGYEDYVDDQRGQAYERNYEEPYGSNNAHSDSWRYQACSTYYKGGHDNNQDVEESHSNSAQQFAYSDCTSEEALRRHLARLAASKRWKG